MYDQDNKEVLARVQQLTAADATPLKLPDR